MRALGAEGLALGDEEDGFSYDVLHLPDGSHRPLKIRSMVGLIPIFAVETLEPETIDRLPGFRRRMQWFIDNHPEFREHVVETKRRGGGVGRPLSLATPDPPPRGLRVMLGESEVPSPPR